MILTSDWRNIVFISDYFSGQLTCTVTGELGIDNQQIFKCFMCWVIFLNDYEFVTVEFKNSAPTSTVRTKRAIEVESLIIKDAYNTRIGLTLIDILYRSTPCDMWICHTDFPRINERSSRINSRKSKFQGMWQSLQGILVHLWTLS